MEPSEAFPSSSIIGTLEALEPRIMFDGAALVTGAEVVQELVTQDQATHEQDSQVLTGEPDKISDSFIDDIDLFSALSTGGRALSDRKEIVFIDTSVDNFQTLMEGIDSNAEVILLDFTRDGIEQIAEILSARSEIDAIHIISHGDQGELRLGTGVLNLATMQGEYADELATINQALTDEADWLIYGCNFGEGLMGQEAATLLAKLTGADIAASNDLTGNTELGGDWDLEVETGKIETLVVVNAEVQQVWSGILADGDTSVSFQEGVDGYTGTQDTFVDEFAPSTSQASATALQVDLDDGGGNGTHTLIRFDSLFGSGSNQIPTGAAIISASLTFDVTIITDTSATIGLYRMLSTWSEGSTWNSLTNGIQTNDVEASSTADAVVPITDSLGTVKIAGLEGSLQAWADGATNYGWAIKNNSTTGWYVRSSEDGTNSLRPQLTVEYRTTGGDITTGLVGLWNVDANADDSSGNTNHGTLTGGALVDTTDLTDKVGAGKLSLDGTDDYVDLNSHLSNFSSLTEGTISAWVKLTAQNERAIFSVSDGGDARSFATFGAISGTIFYRVDEGGSTILDVNSGSNRIDDNAWHHVAVTVDGTGNKMFIDGVQLNPNYVVGSASSTPFFNDVTDLDTIAIGRQVVSSSGRWYFNGLMDDVRVYNRPLSVADIAAVAAEAPVATNDAATTGVDTAVNVNVIANDTDFDSETITVLDVGNPTNGTVVNNDDGTVTYTPTTSYTGGDTFTYLTADLDDTVSYWRLDGDGTDAVGANNGTLTGTTTVPGVYGDALLFDDTMNDKVVVPDFAVNDEFSLSFKFKVDDNTGSSYQYFYSHGALDAANSLNVTMIEDSLTDGGTIRTLLYDTNDAVHSTGELDIEASHLVDDNQWHTYTLTVASGGGAKVYLDGVLKNSAGRGGDSYNPTTDVYFGAREDLSATRFYGGYLDSVQLFNRALNAEEVNDTHTGGSSLATVTIGVGDLVVDTASDIADGDTSSIGALMIDKGADGFISLREAITAANSTPNGATPDEISFSIGTGLQTITLGAGSGLPDITDPLILDATTQPGYAGTPIIQIDGTAATGATAGLRLLTNDSTIKGFIIHSSADEGLEIDGSTGFGDNNTLQNNWLGVDSTGAADPNTEHGILLTDGAAGNQIGGTGLNEGNVMSSNGLAGIYIRKAGTDNNIVEGNLIGVAPNGSTAVANTTYGVWIDDTASGNTIGGTTTAAANVIANNTLDGIAVTGLTTGNAFLGNSIHTNTGLGIDLTDDAVTANDLNDVDTGTGPNNLQNFPLLTTAATTGTQVTIKGSLDTNLLNQNYRVEFFRNTVSTGQDATSHGEGEDYLDFITVMTDGSGNATFNSTLSVAVAAGEFITATATVDNGGGSYGDTSEFARNLAATAVPVNNVPGAQVVDEDTALVFNAANSNLISISDDDAGANPSRVTLTATNGIMTLSQTMGLMFSTGDGTADAVMTFEGTLTNINAALDGLSFIGNQDFNGAANIQMTTDDLTLTSLNEDSNLQGYYTFDDTGDLGNDDSPGGAHDGTVNGAVTNNDATRGNVLSLDGNDDYVDVTGAGALFGSPANLTLSAWVNYSSVDTFGGEVISLGNNVMLRVDDAVEGVTGIFYDGTTWQYVGSSTSLADGNWHHIAFTFDDAGNAQSLYIDGVLAASDTATSSISYVNGSNTRIGANASDPDNDFDFNGLIDEARIYDRVLTATEIQSLASEPTSTDTDNIVIMVNVVNDAPVEASIEGAALAYTENDGAVAITATLAVTDLDDTNMESAIVQITGNYQNGEDVLAFTDQNGITGTWTVGTGTLTLTGTATVANYETALRSLTYENTSDAPSTLPRTVSFTVNDGEVDSNTQTRDIAVTAVNDAPVEASIEGAALAYTENDGAVAITATLAVTDLDDTNMESAIVQITGNYQNGEDVLAFTDQNGITGTWTVGTGTLTLTGTATVANYETALRSLTYENTSDAPSTLPRTVSFTVNDGEVDSNTQTRDIAVTAVNDAPVEASIEGAALAYTENDGAVAITATLAVTDLDDTNMESAIVQITGNYQNGEDVLAFTDQNGITGTWTVGTGTLTLTGTATVANYETALRSLTYENTSDAPSTLPRTVSFTVNDGEVDSNTQTRDIAVTAVNDAPVEASIEGAALAYTENDGAVAITATLAVTDLDDTNMESAIVQITGNYQNGEDVLAFTDQNGITGTWTVGTGTLTLTGTATVANYETALRSLTYENTSDAPSTLPRTVSFTVNDGEVDSNTQTRDIAVTAVNDAPVEASIEGAALAYTENDGAVAITATLAVTDLDDTNMESAIVQITGNYQNGEDVLAFTDQNGITGTWTVGTGTLTLTGTATVANYETALRSLTYENTSDAPSTLPRTVSFTVNDGEVDSNTQTRDIAVTAVNDAPVITSDGGGAIAPVNAVENQTGVTTVLATDVDLPSDALTYTIAGGADQGLFVINGGSGVLTFSTAPNFEVPTDADTNGVYDVTVQVADGNGGFDTQAISVSVSDGSDAPTITSNGGGSTAVVTVAENQTALTTVTAMDSDLPPGVLTYTIVGGADSALFSINGGSGVLTFNSAPDFETPSDANFDGVYEVIVQVADGNGGIDSQIILVPVTDLLEGLPPTPPDSTPDLPPDPSPNRTSEPVPDQDPVKDSGPLLRGYDEGKVGRGPDSEEQRDNKREAVDILNLPPFLHQVGAMTSGQIRAYYSDPLDLAKTTLPTEFLQQLNRFSDELKEAMNNQVEERSLFVQMVKGTGLALSAGLAAWLVRGGAFIAWFLSSLPAWRYIDPIPILGLDKKEKEAWVRRAKEAGTLEAQEHHGLDQIL